MSEQNGTETVLQEISANSARQLRIQCSAAPLQAALLLLEQALERAPEVVQRFLSGLDSPAQLCRIHADDGLALGAGQFGVALQPSDLLRDFLATGFAWDVEALPVQV